MTYVDVVVRALTPQAVRGVAEGQAAGDCGRPGGRGGGGDGAEAHAARALPQARRPLLALLD